jgi:Mlc titration factor MtfA (ptsG expression regulator)
MSNVYVWAIAHSGDFRKWYYERHKLPLFDASFARFGIVVTDEATVKSKAGRSAAGCCDWGDETIYVCEQGLNVLLHEVGHMLFPMANGENNEDDEKVAERFAEWMSRQMRSA